jgi:hypothetical protein
MGLRDRDYMRDQPDDEAYEKYDKGVFDAEYGLAAAKRKAKIRRIVIAFGIILFLVVLIAGLVSYK